MTRSWTPYATTPPYSEHSSGYNCVTAAYMHTGRGFFGSNQTDLSVQNLVTGVTTGVRAIHPSGE